jgi:hypothetical protein
VYNLTSTQPYLSAARSKPSASFAFIKVWCIAVIDMLHQILKSQTINACYEMHRCLFLHEQDHTTAWPWFLNTTMCTLLFATNQKFDISSLIRSSNLCQCIFLKLIGEPYGFLFRKHFNVNFKSSVPLERYPFSGSNFFDRGW